MKKNNIFAAGLQLAVLGCMLAVLLAACGGGSSGSGATAAAVSYTTSAGVGEVMQFSIDTSAMTYSYKIDYTSYAASGILDGKSGSGALTGQNLNGSYNVGPSSDGFITGGKVLTLQNGLLVGHVQIALFGIIPIPVFGFSSPVTTLADLDGTYNYQGFTCSSLGIAYASNPACTARYGTISVASGVYNVCKNGDVSNVACAATASGVIVAQPATPGVFDYRNASNNHVGWFFAFVSPNGQKIAVIDHDDGYLFKYGHTVAATYVSAVPGTLDGKYFIKDNEGGETLMTVSGVNMTFLSVLPIPGVSVSGTLTYNTPWPGMNNYLLGVSGVPVTSGVSMTAGTGVDTYISNINSAVFGAGIRYSP